MADLDDFFAKKDKKKSKATKPKFLTAEELVKNLEDTSKREAALKALKKADPPIVAPSATTEPDAVIGSAGGDEIKNVVVEQPEQTDEEWKEFEEEQRKDYSGLKIGQLTLNDDDDQSQTEVDDDEGDSESNYGNDVKRSGGGPWKKVIPAEEVTQIPMVQPYISPALRNSQGFGASRIVKPRNRAAPDITNADYFPTLGAARPEEQRKKKNEPVFEEVRHGGRLQRVKEVTAAPVSVTNRFQSLEEDDS